jgi:hypothetical protein
MANLDRAIARQRRANARAKLGVILEEAGGRFDDPVSSNGRIDLSGLY